MKKTKILRTVFIYILIFSLMLGICSVCAGAVFSSVPAPDIEANAVYAWEDTSGTEMLNKNGNAQIYPASTTKIMTVLLAIEAIDDGVIEKDEKVTLPSGIYYDITPDGSTQNLSSGEEMKFSDVIRCALIASANEACNSIALLLSNDTETFISLMNSRAKALGCTGTHFTNTHGLPADDHYTTAHDLVLIFKEAYKYDLFREIISTEEYTVPATNLFDKRELDNTNRLILPNAREYCDYCIGGKTGYTNAAGYCLVSAAEKNGLTVISAVMGTEAETLSDGYRQTKSFTETKKVYDYVFDNFSYINVLEEGELICEIPVSMGDGADSVILCSDASVTALLPNNTDLSKRELTTDIVGNAEDGTFTAPISKGYNAGTMSVSIGGVTYGTVGLVTNRSIELQKLEFIKAEIKQVLSNSWIRIFIIFLVVIIAAYIIFVIIYNSKRSMRRKKEKRAASKKLEELRRGESLTTGSSFEDIEKKYADRQASDSKFR